MTGAYVKFETKPTLKCSETFLISFFCVWSEFEGIDEALEENVKPGFEARIFHSNFTSNTVQCFGNPDGVCHFSQFLAAHHAVFFVSFSVGFHELLEVRGQACLA